MELDKRLLQGEQRAVARLISMAENEDPEAITILSRLYPHTGKARIIGITGPPGAGKSTLTDKLVKVLRKENKMVGIIAVDPTSPFTGGAILGDRIRMSDLYTDPGVFIRSMGTRGHLGGMAKATQAAIKVLDAYGVDVIIIETVGVGQSEVDIVKTADTVVMVMVPGLGDDIQAIKAGIMEIGDVFVINKADREGVERTKIEVEMMLDFNHWDWRPPVHQVIATENSGVNNLAKSLENHYEFLVESGQLMERRRKNSELEILALTQESLLNRVLKNQESRKEIKDLATLVVDRRLDPYEASQRLVRNIIEGEQ